MLLMISVVVGIGIISMFDPLLVLIEISCYSYADSSSTQSTIITARIAEPVITSIYILISYYRVVYHC